MEEELLSHHQDSLQVVVAPLLEKLTSDLSECDSVSIWLCWRMCVVLLYKYTYFILLSSMAFIQLDLNVLTVTG